jgi:hypothetical protein
MDLDDRAAAFRFLFRVCVPETVMRAVDLLLRRQPATGMIRRWRCD